MEEVNDFLLFDVACFEGGCVHEIAHEFEDLVEVELVVVVGVVAGEDVVDGEG